MLAQGEYYMQLQQTDHQADLVRYPVADQLEFAEALIDPSAPNAR
jgi:hypothetical protein